MGAGGKNVTLCLIVLNIHHNRIFTSTTLSVRPQSCCMRIYLERMVPYDGPHHICVIIHYSLLSVRAPAIIFLLFYG